MQIKTIGVFYILYFFNWDSLHARLNSHLQGMYLIEKEAHIG